MRQQAIRHKLCRMPMGLMLLRVSPSEGQYGLPSHLSGMNGRIEIKSKIGPVGKDSRQPRADKLAVGEFKRDRLDQSLLCGLGAQVMARHLIQLLSPGGQFLHISTKYLAQPVRGFALARPASPCPRDSWPIAALRIEKQASIADLTESFLD